MTSAAVFEAVIWVKINVYNKVVLENKKDKYSNKRQFHLNLNLKMVEIEFTAWYSKGEC